MSTRMGWTVGAACLMIAGFAVLPAPAQDPKPAGQEAGAVRSDKPDGGKEAHRKELDASRERLRAAYLADRPLGDWIKVWSNRMRAQATLTLIHRAHRLGDILDALDGRLGGVEVLPIYPSARDGARRVIVRARKGSRAPLQILRGLVLHPSEDTKEKYTPEADALLRGEAQLWFG